MNWHGKGTGPSSRVTISPLVDIRSRLVDQSNTDLFTVISPTRAYWRLTSLDTFDGSIWKSSGRYTSVDGRLPDPLPSGIADPGLPGEVEQTFRISALSALWLPAAFEPVSVDAPDTSVRYQKDSSTLIVDTNVPTSDGQTYTVRSVLPTFTPDELRAATTVMPDVGGPPGHGAAGNAQRRRPPAGHHHHRGQGHRPTTRPSPCSRSSATPAASCTTRTSPRATATTPSSTS